MINNIMRHNSKEAYRIIKDLTTEGKGKVSTTQDKKGNYIEKMYYKIIIIINRQTEIIF